MKLLRKIALSTAALALGLGATLVASPASAALPAPCPTNKLCFYTSGNVMIYIGDGTTLYHTTGYTAVGSLKTYRSVNNTLGRFCTYSANLTTTNILAPQTSGVVANQTTIYVKKC